MRSKANKFRSVAYHEAGHAVARVLAAKLPGTSVVIHQDRTGENLGTGELITSSDQYKIWDLLIHAAAGVYAEARITKRSIDSTWSLYGRGDRESAGPHIEWLCAHGFAVNSDAAWLRVHQETRDFVRQNWAAIVRVAAALLERHQLNAAEVAALIEKA